MFCLKYAGEKISTFNDEIDTPDAVIVAVKAKERDHEVKKICKVVDGVPIYVCFSRADTQVKMTINEDEDDDGEITKELEEKWSENAIEDLDRWCKEFCHVNDLDPSNVHFVMPSACLIEKAIRINEHSKVEDDFFIKSAWHLAELRTEEYLTEYFDYP